MCVRWIDVVGCVRLSAAVEPGKEVTVHCGRYINHQETTTTTTTTTTVLTTSSATSSSLLAASSASTTTTATTTTFTDADSTSSRRSHVNNTYLQPSPQTSPTVKYPRSLRNPAKKSATWQRHYKSGSVGKFIDGRNEDHGVSAKTRAKLHRLAQKFATSDNSVNGINKADYKDLVRSEARYQAVSRSSYWKGLHDGFDDDQYKTSTKAAAPYNVTYSETVHDSSETLLGDGQTSVFGVTEKSAVGIKKQEILKTKTETNDDSVPDVSAINKNSTKVEIAPQRHFEVESNAIPTFPDVESTARTVQKPKVGAHNLEKVYRLAKEGGPRISRNEIHSKVGRDPPFWVPVEPLRQEPFLREPDEKHIAFEEPYEPIPPLAKNDISHQNWIQDSETKPSVSSPVNVSQVTVRQRPEAKEGGALQLEKIASPLEQKWIRKAHMAHRISESSTDNTQPNSGDFYRNITMDQPSKFTIHNHTERKFQHDYDDVRTTKNKPHAIPIESNCATTSWNNVQLVQDTLNGGYYVIQEQVHANCSKQNAANSDKGQEQVSINEHLTLKPEQHDRSIVEQSRSSIEPGQTDDSGTSPLKVREAGWMYFDLDGNLTKDIRHHQVKDPSESKPGVISSIRDVSQYLLNDTDHMIQLSGDSSPVNDFTEDLVRYYLTKEHPKGQDSRVVKEEITNLMTDHLLNKDQTDISSERNIVLTSRNQTPSAVLGPPVPTSGQESLYTDDVIGSGFPIADQTKISSWQEDRSAKSRGKSTQNSELPEGQTRPDTVQAVVPAAFHADSGNQIASISGQSITWGKKH